jgi:hypothetical protein
MKHLKRLGAAAVAAAVVLVCGAGSASATELYSTGVTLSAGTTFHMILNTSLVTSTTDGKTIVGTCTANTIEGKTTNTSGSTVTVAIDKLVWGGCTVTTDTLTPGTLHIDAAGTVSGSGTVWTVNTGVTCRYGTGTGTHLGTLSTGKLVVNAVINEQEPKAFLCPDTTKLVANYAVASPHDLTAGP